MSNVMRMAHVGDPADELRKKVGDISAVGLHFNQVLVATYVRPSKTASGIELPDSVRKEDEYQGKVGLILKFGPIAFENSGEDNFNGSTPKIGDWVFYRMSDGWPIKLNGCPCRILEDVHVKGTISEPDIIY